MATKDSQLVREKGDSLRFPDHDYLEDTLVMEKNRQVEGKEITKEVEEGGGKLRFPDHDYLEDMLEVDVVAVGMAEELLSH